MTTVFMENHPPMVLVERTFTAFLTGVPADAVRLSVCDNHHNNRQPSASVFAIWFLLVPCPSFGFHIVLLSYNNFQNSNSNPWSQVQYCSGESFGANRPLVLNMKYFLLGPLKRSKGHCHRGHSLVRAVTICSFYKMIHLKAAKY